MYSFVNERLDDSFSEDILCDVDERQGGVGAKNAGERVAV